MTVTFRDNDRTTRLQGDLFATGGSAGDVLTQQADGTYAPAAGGAFNGGTITDPLVINRPAETSDELTVTGLHTSFVVDGFGDFTFTGDAGVATSFQATGAGNDAVLNVQGDSGQFNVNTASTMQWVRGGVTIFRVSDTYLKFRLNAAPADGSLSAGECALWLDSTNGAAKLMIKAKQADGTVRTGSVNLA